MYLLIEVLIKEWGKKSQGAEVEAHDRRHGPLPEQRVAVEQQAVASERHHQVDFRIGVEHYELRRPLGGGED